MERLVIKSKAGSYYLNDAARGVMFEPYEIEPHQRRLLLKRLYEYEDTGLTPPEIMVLKERDAAMEINEIHVDEYYCPACGAENNCDQGVVEDNFCPRCGRRLKRRED